MGQRKQRNVQEGTGIDSMGPATANKIRVECNLIPKGNTIVPFSRCCRSR